jgi:hypothetical protein
MSACACMCFISQNDNWKEVIAYFPVISLWQSLVSGSCSYIDMGSPVIEFRPFEGTQQSRCLPLTWGCKQIQFSKRCVL